MTTWANENRNSASYAAPSRSSAAWASPNISDDITFFVSEALDFYLVGASENEFLIADTATEWTNQVKNG